MYLLVGARGLDGAVVHDVDAVYEGQVLQLVGDQHACDVTELTQQTLVEAETKKIDKGCEQPQLRQV